MGRDLELPDDTHYIDVRLRFREFRNSFSRELIEGEDFEVLQKEIDVRLTLERFTALVATNQLKEGEHYEHLHRVGIKNEAYPDDPEWKELNSKSVKAYKAKKDREYELRNS
ncbi:MAG: hypothetical protein ACRBG0_19250 [Lewinella sp.]|uniref:hypothetical protein n=1 Tax=Lewinella sp. TaxID=2004506 RepID=UPI003D6ADABE